MFLNSEGRVGYGSEDSPRYSLLKALSDATTLRQFVVEMNRVVPAQVGSARAIFQIQRIPGFEAELLLDVQ